MQAVREMKRAPKAPFLCSLIVKKALVPVHEGGW